MPGSPAGIWPIWERDGTKIAFASLRNGNAQIYVMNADGTGAKRLTNGNDSNLAPAWSKDGTKIAFDRALGATISRSL